MLWSKFERFYEKEPSDEDGIPIFSPSTALCRLTLFELYCIKLMFSKLLISLTIDILSNRCSVANCFHYHYHIFLSVVL